MTEKERKKFQKILARNDKFFARQSRKYARGRKREVKKVYKHLMREHRHIKNYKVYPQDIFYYMRANSQYSPSSIATIERIMKEVL